MVGEVVPVQGQEVFLTPAQYDELKKIDVDQHKELMDKLDLIIQNSQTTDTSMLENLDTINQNILLTNESIGNIPAVDNTELVNKMNDFITTINSFSETFSWVGTASSTIITYGVFYIPLLVIVLALWWFFKQFIR